MECRPTNFQRHPNQLDAKDHGEDQKQDEPSQKCGQATSRDEDHTQAMGEGSFRQQNDPEASGGQKQRRGSSRGKTTATTSEASESEKVSESEACQYKSPLQT
jgi:hypothetical protein